MTPHRVRANFSKHAAHYNDYAIVQSHVGDRLWQSLDGDSPRHILDLGCGTGRWTAGLAEAFAEADITAIDFSAAMIEQAKKTLKNTAIRFEVGDIREVSFDRPFDLIVSNASLHWCHPIAPLFKKYAAQLTPNGTMAASLYGPGTFCELSASMAELSEAPIEISAVQFASIETLSAAFRPLFSTVDIWQEIITQVYPDLRTLLRHIKKTGTQGTGLKNRGLWTPRFLDRLSKQYLHDHGQFRCSSQIFYLKGRR